MVFFCFWTILELITKISYHSSMKSKDIFSQGSSLITKYVLYLSELLIEGGRSGIDFAFSPHRIHKLIEVYEVTLSSLRYFDGDYQCNWDA